MIMKVTPRRPSETGRDYALRSLEYNIIHLNLEPGLSISENELAQQLGLSRTPVREALIELSKVEIVRIIPQKGSMISLIDPLLVEQAHFMRSTLECAAVELAIEKLTEEDIASLEEILKQQKLHARTKGTNTEVSFIELDNAFHERIFEIAQKPTIFHIIQSMAIHFDRIRHMTIDYMKSEEVTSEHEAILKAITSRDRETAVSLMKSHIGRFRLIEGELRKTYPNYFVPE